MSARRDLAGQAPPDRRRTGLFVVLLQMRIISGHDYYDSALAYGQDSDVVFVRKKDDFRAKIPAALMPPDNFWIYFRKSGDKLFVDRDAIETGEGKNHCSFRAEPVYVWFCGKRYGGVQWGGIRGDVDILAPSYFWSYAELKTFVESLGYRLSINNPYFLKGTGRQQIADHFDVHDFPQIEDWLIEQRITIATIVPRHGRYGPAHTIQIDGPNLKELEFYKAKNAFQAFQEISQWVGGVLPRPGNPMVEIRDDKVKIHKAGFDIKQSFRKRRTP